MFCKNDFAFACDMKTLYTKLLKTAELKLMVLIQRVLAEVLHYQVTPLLKGKKTDHVGGVYSAFLPHSYRSYCLKNCYPFPIVESIH